MKIISTLIAGVGLTYAVTAGDVLWKADFTDEACWSKPKEFSGPFRYARKPDTFGIAGTATNSIDTAWQLETGLISLAVRGKYAICYTFESKGIIKYSLGTSSEYDTAVFWYDESGAQLARHSIPVVCADGNAYDYRWVCEVPAGATQFRVRLGFDGPNLDATKRLRFSNLRLESAAPDEALGGAMPDVRGPRVRITSETPTRRMTAPVVITASDPSGIDVDSLVVSVDGKPCTDFTRRMSGDDLVVEILPGVQPWSEGLHKIGFKIADRHGRVNDAQKIFLIGDVPHTPIVTLRDDGMTIVGGEPFFPIGIYGVCKRDFNAYNWDRALADLKDAGFNTVHSYDAPRDPEFHRVALKYGMRMWMEAYVPDKAIVNTFRHDPAVIAWYLGDDTSSCTTPEKLHDRDDNIRAVDPTRLTTQADVYGSRYIDYAALTDNFLAEIYPVRGENQSKDRQCVAETAYEMDCIAKCQRKSGRAHNSVWPIIQYFKGWGWKRFPTNDEFYGMSFAAIIHGAQGITWYTYGGFVRPEKKKFNYGVTSSEDVWRNTTNVTRRIASLLPVLVERNPVQPPIPSVRSGPVNDALGNPSVTVLLKVKDGVHYLFAVNAADAEVKASFALDVKSDVEVLWEKRKITVDKCGGFNDTFKPLGVHVYKWR